MSVLESGQYTYILNKKFIYKCRIIYVRNIKNCGVVQLLRPTVLYSKAFLDLIAHAIN